MVCRRTKKAEGKLGAEIDRLVQCGRKNNMHTSTFGTTPNRAANSRVEGDERLSGIEKQMTKKKEKWVTVQ